MMKQKIINLGGKEWTKHDMERVYITSDMLNVLLEEQGKGSYRLSERNNKIFYDVKANAVMRSYKGKKPSVEIQYS
jgi:hypothetical protein